MSVVSGVWEAEVLYDAYGAYRLIEGAENEEAITGGLIKI
jgi:hypothetical protein